MEKWPRKRHEKAHLCSEGGEQRTGLVSPGCGSHGASSSELPSGGQRQVAAGRSSGRGARPATLPALSDWVLFRNRRSGRGGWGCLLRAQPPSLLRTWVELPLCGHPDLPAVWSGHAGAGKLTGHLQCSPPPATGAHPGPSGQLLFPLTHLVPQDMLQELAGPWAPPCCQVTVLDYFFLLILL